MNENPSDRERKPAPGLYLVATPIGNARDITLRALDVLRAADLVACEDTRTFRNLASLHGLQPKVVAHHAHNEAHSAEGLIDAALAGQVVAVVSDAGMPTVSDPGERLVRRAAERGAPVTVIPGPSAALAALALSGLPSEPFLFAGFLPSARAERRRALAALAAVPATLVLFEAPHRIAESLADAAELLGDRPAALARELTKTFEEVRRGPLSTLADAGSGERRGEMVLVIGPPQADASAADEATVDAALREALAQTGVKPAAAEVAARFGLRQRDVYARALKLQRGGA